MKNLVLKTFFGLALIMFTFSSCDLFDKADDVTFEIELTHTFHIDENDNSQGSPVSYSDVGLIEATKDTEFDKYKDKIKEIKVNSITYTVANYDNSAGSVTFINGKGRFRAPGNTTTALASADLDIQNIQSSVGGSFTLNYTVDGLSAIANQLESVHAVDFEVSGTFSKTPVAFDVPVVISCTVTANALD